MEGLGIRMTKMVEFHIVQCLSSTVQLHMVHLFVAPLEIAITSHHHLLLLGLEARCDPTNTSKSLRVDGRAFS